MTGAQSPVSGSRDDGGALIEARQQFPGQAADIEPSGFDRDGTDGELEHGNIGPRAGDGREMVAEVEAVAHDVVVGDLVVERLVAHVMAVLRYQRSGQLADSGLADIAVGGGCGEHDVAESGGRFAGVGRGGVVVVECSGGGGAVVVEDLPQRFECLEDARAGSADGAGGVGGAALVACGGPDHGGEGAPGIVVEEVDGEGVEGIGDADVGRNFGGKQGARRVGTGRGAGSEGGRVKRDDSKHYRLGSV